MSRASRTPAYDNSTGCWIDTFDDIDGLEVMDEAIVDNGDVFVGGGRFFRPITIDNTGNPDTLTAYPVQINITRDSKMQADYDDLRFKDSSGNPVSYWLQEANATGASVWVNVSSIPGSGTTTINMYYGCPYAGSGSDIKAVSVFYDDFEDMDYTKNQTWTVAGGTYSAVNGYLEHTSSFTGLNIYSTDIHISSARCLILEFDTMLTSTHSIYNGIYLKNSTDDIQMGGLPIRCGYSGKQEIRVYSTNGYNKTDCTVSTSTWHHVKVIYTRGDYLMLYDQGTYEANHTGDSMINVSKIHITGWQHQSGSRFDNIFVRKYTDPEPTYSIGAEQTDPGEAIIISKAIDPPALDTWSKFNATATVPSGTSIKYEILNASDNTTILEIVPGQNIGGIVEDAIRLKATLTATATATAVLHDWGVSWNIVPLDIKPENPFVFRCRDLNISVHSVYFREVDTPIFEYRYTLDPDQPANWHTEFLWRESYINSTWSIVFTPTYDASLGEYVIRVKFPDNEIYKEWYYADRPITVFNNPPSTPEIDLTPESPDTTVPLECEITVSSYDPIDGDYSVELTYTFEWYKDGVHQPLLTVENITYLNVTVPSNLTKEGEQWQCRVRANDGINYSKEANATVIIVNTAPYVTEQLPDKITMFEDTPYEMDYTDMFIDPDEQDTLLCHAVCPDGYIADATSTSGIIELVPMENWHGNTRIEFALNDSTAETNVMVNVVVESVNDVPVIYPSTEWSPETSEANVLNCRQSESTKTTIKGEDLADPKDKLTYHVTPMDEGSQLPANLSISTVTGVLEFLPGNSEVGTYYLNVSVMDNGHTANKPDPRSAWLNLTVIVENINDPPSMVRILEPENGTMVMDRDKLNFTGMADDPDLHIPGSKEILSYRWESNISGDLGSGKELSDIELGPGYHFITLTVADLAGASLNTSINVTILPSIVVDDDDVDPTPVNDTGNETEADDDEEEEDEGINKAVFIVPLIILLIIIAIIIVIVYMKRRKGEDETPEPAEAEEVGEPIPISEPSPLSGEGYSISPDMQEPPLVPLAMGADEAPPPSTVQDIQVILPDTTPDEPGLLSPYAVAATAAVEDDGLLEPCILPGDAGEEEVVSEDTAAPPTVAECYNCSAGIEISSQERPLEIECPQCGVECVIE